MRLSKNSIITLFVLVFSLILTGFSVEAKTEGVWHPASEVIGGADASEEDAVFPDAYYKFQTNLDVGQQVTAGTAFVTGSSSLTSSQFIVNTDTIYTTAAGDVGIGTAPSQLLHLKQDIAEGPMIRLDRTANSNINDVAILGVAYWSDASNDSFWIGRGTTDADKKLVLQLNSGNVGLGTASPAFKLEVVGGTGGQETSLLSLRSNSTSNNTATTLRLTNSTAANPSHHRAEITALRTNSPASGAHDLFFKLSDGTSMVERIRVKSTGNVGIGTSSPAYKLTIANPDIADPNEAGFSVMSAPELGTLGIYVEGLGEPVMRITPSGQVGVNKIPTSGYDLDVKGNVSAANYYGNGNTLSLDVAATGGVENTQSTTIRADSDDDGTGAIYLDIASNTALFVKNNSNVGIGTINPIYSLSIDKEDTGLGEPPQDTLVDSGALAFYTGLTERMRISSNGNIGIGTGTDILPQERLHLRSTGSVGILLEADAVTPGDESYHPVIKLSQDQGSVHGELGYFGTSNILELKNTGWGSHLYLGAGGSTRVYILDNGNVGIGASPSYKLHVAGDIYGTGDLIILGGGSFTNPVMVGTPTADAHATTKLYVDNAIAGVVGGTVANALACNADGVCETHLISADNAAGDNYFAGNVGIGVTPPGYELEVSGKIYGTNIEAANQVAAGTEFRTGSSYLAINGGYVAGSFGVQNLPNCPYIKTIDASGTFGCGASGDFLTGSGTSDKIAKWTNGTTLGDSIMSEGGTTISIGGDLSVGKIDSTGGIQLNTGAQPACDLSTRGTLWFTQSASGVKDTLEVCAKDATDAYAWRTVW